MLIMDRSSIDASFRRVLDRLRSSACVDLTLAMVAEDGSLAASSSCLQTLLTMKVPDGLDGVIHTMVRDACIAAERVGPGSSRPLIEILSAMRDSVNVKSVIDGLVGASKHVTHDAMRSHMASLKGGSIVWHALEMAGSECRIFVEPNTGTGTIIERIDGCTFNVAPDASMLSDGRWSAHDVRLLLVDGIIESVGEIDHILARCNETKCPLLLCARGFRDDVRSTLRLNSARGTLNVVSIDVPFDLGTANMLSDIGAASSSDVVSALKGELVSTLSLDDLARVDHVSIVGSVLTIVNPSSAGRLASHAAMLLRKRNDETIPDIKRILDRRLRSLSALTVAIRVDNTGVSGARAMHDIDEALRAAKGMLSNGIVGRDNVIEALLPIIGRDVACSIIKTPTVPLATIVSAVRGAGSLWESIRSAGAVIVEDQIT